MQNNEIYKEDGSIVIRRLIACRSDCRTKWLRRWQAGMRI